MLRVLLECELVGIIILATCISTVVIIGGMFFYGFKYCAKRKSHLPIIKQKSHLPIIKQKSHLPIIL